MLSNLYDVCSCMQTILVFITCISVPAFPASCMLIVFFRRNGVGIVCSRCLLFFKRFSKCIQQVTQHSGSFLIDAFVCQFLDLEWVHMHF